MKRGLKNTSAQSHARCQCLDLDISRFFALPSEVKNEIHPTKEQSDRAHLQSITCLTVTRRKDENNGSDIADPLHDVYEVEYVGHAL